MQPRTLIRAHGLRSKQLGQLSRRTTTQQIHLEKPLLPVYPAKRPRDIDSVAPLNGRHTQGIAFHRYRRAKSRHGRLPIELRKTAAHLEINPTHRHEGDKEQATEKKNETAQKFHRDRESQIDATIASGAGVISTFKASSGISKVAS